MGVKLPPFQRLLDAHRDDVHRFLVASAGPQDADDCFQETFIAALRAYPRLRDGSNLRAWLLTIAHRKAIDAHRARGRRPVPVAEPPETAAPASNSRDPDLWERVRALPPKQRGAVVLRYVGDLSHAEIARTLRCSDDAARRSLHEGLAKLRKDATQ
jgi:RNA polymerase sigma factor (sigma-70 family)